VLCFFGKLPNSKAYLFFIFKNINQMMYSRIFFGIFFLTFLIVKMTPSAHGQSALELVESQNLEALKAKVAKEGKQILQTNYDLLIKAANNCDQPMAKYLLENGAKLAQSDEQAARRFNTELAYDFCHIHQDWTAEEKCKIDMMTLLITNGIPVSNYTYYHFHCNYDVGSDWYKMMKPVYTALLKRGLKLEEALAGYDDDGKDSYMLELCQYDKEFSDATIQNYLLFFASNGTDFKAKVQGKVPYNLLSEKTQRKIDAIIIAAQKEKEQKNVQPVKNTGKKPKNKK